MLQEIISVAGVASDIGASVVKTVGCGVSALGVAMIGYKAVDSVGRNPGAAGKVLVQSILGMALAEAISFYVLFFA